MTNHDILGQLERLAASFPWDQVAIWATRQPEGQITFNAILQNNPKFGFSFDSTSADTPEAAVDQLIRDNPNRDPEPARQAKIAELREQIQKLEAVVIGLPPYVPNRELSQFVNRTVDV